MAALESELLEIEGWSCCGASAATASSRLLSLALPARNLALAERNEALSDILVPCSACYLNLKRVEETLKSDPGGQVELNQVLEAEALQIQGRKRVRHLLDVLSRDVGPEGISKKRKKRLGPLRVAPYYGCQCLRPYAVFDDPEKPRSMEALIEATGAVVHDWHMGAKCCGASHITTEMDVGLKLVTGILKDARGADAIVTVCPMCQMNLEAYQGKIARQAKEPLAVTVLYLPQLLGLCLGISLEDLGIDKNLSVTDAFRQRLT
jgi:heterodisulfide reductase subunit B